MDKRLAGDTGRSPRRAAPLVAATVTTVVGIAVAQSFLRFHIRRTALPVGGSRAYQYKIISCKAIILISRQPKLTYGMNLIFYSGN